MSEHPQPHPDQVVDETTAKTATVIDRVGLAITRSMKLVGMGVVVNEVFLRSQLRPVAMAVAAFMLAGANGFEDFLDRLFGR